VAAPIFDHRGEVNAALTVGGPRRRVTAKWDMMAAAVMDAASSVSAALGYHGRAQVPHSHAARNGRQTPPTGKRAAASAHHTNGWSAVSAAAAPEGAASNGRARAPRIREVKAPSAPRKTTSRRRTARG